MVFRSNMILQSSLTDTMTKVHKQQYTIFSWTRLSSMVTHSATKRSIVECFCLQPAWPSARLWWCPTHELYSLAIIKLTMIVGHRNFILSFMNWFNPIHEPIFWETLLDSLIRDNQLVSLWLLPTRNTDLYSILRVRCQGDCVAWA